MYILLTLFLSLDIVNEFYSSFVCFFLFRASVGSDVGIGDNEIENFIANCV